MRKLRQLSLELFKANMLEAQIHRYCVVLIGGRHQIIRVCHEEVFDDERAALKRAKEMIRTNNRVSGSFLARQYAALHVVVDAFTVQELEMSPFLTFTK